MLVVDLQIVERDVGAFKNPELLRDAFTHGSVGPGAAKENQRLEFLGDAVIDLVVGKMLFQRFPDAREEHLTNARALLVNDVALGAIMNDLRWKEAIMLGPGELRQGGRDKPSIKANVLEAAIGALFLDRGYETAEAFVTSRFKEQVAKVDLQNLKSAKSRLQELLTKPVRTHEYRETSKSGPAHQPTFEVEVLVDGQPVGRGVARSRQEAEEAAARAALRELGSEKD